jgi:hypothetical protein
MHIGHHTPFSYEVCHSPSVITVHGQTGGFQASARYPRSATPAGEEARPGPCGRDPAARRMIVPAFMFANTKS